MTQGTTRRTLCQEVEHWRSMVPDVPAKYIDDAAQDATLKHFINALQPIVDAECELVEHWMAEAKRLQALAYKTSPVDRIILAHSVRCFICAEALAAIVGSKDA